MPWVATDELHISTRTIPPGVRLPGWAQTASMIRILKSLRGAACVRYEPDGPTGPVPQVAAPAPPPGVPMTEAAQRDASWREWIAMKAQPWKHPAAPAEEKQNG